MSGEVLTLTRSYEGKIDKITAERDDARRTMEQAIRDVNARERNADDADRKIANAHRQVLARADDLSEFAKERFDERTCARVTYSLNSSIGEI